jgi:hypothetical protein
MGGSIAFLLRVLPGFSPPLIDTQFWNTGAKEPRLDLIFCSTDEIFLSNVALDRVQERDKRKGTQMSSNRFIDVRLLIEATEKLGAGFGNRSPRLDCKIPEIPET